MTAPTTTRRALQAAEGLRNTHQALVVGACSLAALLGQDGQVNTGDGLYHLLMALADTMERQLDELERALEGM